MNDILIKKSNIDNAGKGAFSLKNFKSGEIIGEYIGNRIRESKRNKLKDDSYVWVLDGKYNGL